jgi:AcrR family transcriptional regulator
MDRVSTAAPRRRPLDGGYQRGLETRDRIIMAALIVFGEEGYVGASTRRIAAEAGVNPPALQYYFDGKEGLHRACGQYILDQTAEILDPALAQARSALGSGAAEPAAVALCDLMEALATLSMARVESPGWSRFMARLQADDAGPAYEMTQRQIAQPLKAITADLIAAAMGLPAGSEAARLRAMLLLSQLSALHLHAASTLQILGWTDFAGANGRMVRSVLRANTLAMLGSPPG